MPRPAASSQATAAHPGLRQRPLRPQPLRAGRRAARLAAPGRDGADAATTCVYSPETTSPSSPTSPSEPDHLDAPDEDASASRRSPAEPEVRQRSGQTLMVRQAPMRQSLTHRTSRTTPARTSTRTPHERTDDEHPRRHPGGRVVRRAAGPARAAHHRGQHPRGARHGWTGCCTAPPAGCGSSASSGSSPPSCSAR